MHCSTVAAARHGVAGSAGVAVVAGVAAAVGVAVVAGGRRWWGLGCCCSGVGAGGVAPVWARTGPACGTAVFSHYTRT